MKALTICQPYAHLISLPDDHHRAKRVENRTWATCYRGPLLIHAGKSRQWLDLSEDGLCDESYGIPLAEMAFGAIVATANLVDCFHLEHGFESAVRRRAWLAGHEHVEGPYCWVLAEVRKLDKPLPYKGAQGLFDIPWATD